MLEESEALVLKCLREVGRGAVRRLPSEVSLEVGQAACGQQPVECRIELWFRHVHRRDAAQLQCLEIRRPVELWRQALQGWSVKLVKHLVGVAELNAGERGPRQLRLEAQHGRGVARRQRRRVAEQRKCSSYVLT